MTSSNRDAGEGLILHDGLTLVVLHNCDLRQRLYHLLTPPIIPFSSPLPSHLLCNHSACMASLHGQNKLLALGEMFFRSVNAVS